MTLNALVSSKSLDIKITAAEKGPNTLPTDIKSADVLSFYTNRSVGREDIVGHFPSLKITSSNDNRNSYREYPTASLPIKIRNTVPLNREIAISNKPLLKITSSNDNRNFYNEYSTSSTPIKISNTVPLNREIPIISKRINISGNPSEFNFLGDNVDVDLLYTRIDSINSSGPPPEPSSASYSSLISGWTNGIRYVDANNGNDANDGLTSGTAWQTFDYAHTQTSSITTPVMLVFYSGVYPASPIHNGDGYGESIFVDGGYERTYLCYPGLVRFVWTANGGYRDCPMGQLSNANSKVIGAVIERNNNGRVNTYEVAMFRGNGTGQRGTYINCVFKETNANGNWSLQYDNNNDMPITIDQCVFYTTENAAGPYSGGAGMTITNSVFTHDDSTTGVSTTNTLFNTSVDSETYETATATNQGINYGTYARLLEWTTGAAVGQSTTTHDTRTITYTSFNPVTKSYSMNNISIPTSLGSQGYSSTFNTQDFYMPIKTNANAIAKSYPINRIGISTAFGSQEYSSTFNTQDFHMPVKTNTTAQQFTTTEIKKINIGKDFSFGKPVRADSVQLSFYTQNVVPLGFFDVNGVQELKELTKTNDPRLNNPVLGVVSDGGGDNNAISGPVQAWGI